MEAAADCNTNLDSLFEDLMHPNPRIQEDACREMAEKYASEALPRLLDLFEHEDPKVYRGAVKGVGFFGYEAFLPVIELYGRTKNQTAKRCCPKAFVQLFKNFPNQPFPDEVMDLLRDAIDDSDMVVVQGGLMCLGQLGKQQLGGDEAVELLVNVLTNENVALVYSATQALADINHPLVASSLKSLMESSTDPLIKEAAESGLARHENLIATSKS
ncbi:phycoerythrobilin:Cys-82 alpha-phycoerythrin lyase/ CpeZ subunit [Synechococcus sp. Minos11]|uniref:HEAT repeat domain-containing protein n=1 Tax=Synechococcus sp. Minos11 TaxID=221341 RepID=UPI0016440AB4|nr:HEAT repeat domain-containing protein [Synechococcus sp. Minos11]QNJ09666.1 phycoerythrobilin:Cys-82 alpha-phycoerythrin lyase/ CpeZ subunit [Synechococcus sp. Minos11]|tara:strand:- start:2353 stop:2997 length:645 start_codon:yes stop_codon:yes gene_type:complete